MSIRRTALLLAVSFLATTSAADAAQLSSNPISHGSGFSSVVCHIVNTGTKPLVLGSFFIEPIITTVSHANDFSGCTGFGPYTIQPGQGCSRRMTTPSVCNQLDACYCYAAVEGSTKTVRGILIGTVTGSTTTVTSELRVK